MMLKQQVRYVIRDKSIFNDKDVVYIGPCGMVLTILSTRGLFMQYKSAKDAFDKHPKCPDRITELLHLKITYDVLDSETK